MDILTMGSGKNLTRLHSLKDLAAASGICLLEMLTKPQGAFPSVLTCPSKALGHNLSSKHRHQMDKRTWRRKDAAFHLGFGSDWTLKRIVQPTLLTEQAHPSDL